MLLLVSPVDLAVFCILTSQYGEGEICFTIEYKTIIKHNGAIEAEIPNNTTLDNASEGEVDKNKSHGKLVVSGKDSGKIEYIVKVMS